MHAAQTLRVREPDPFGEVTLAPTPVAGRSEIEQARAMAEDLSQETPARGPEAMEVFRVRPRRPSLTARLAALAAMMRR